MIELSLSTSCLVPDTTLLEETFYNGTLLEEAFIMVVSKMKLLKLLSVKEYASVLLVTSGGHGLLHQILFVGTGFTRLRKYCLTAGEGLLGTDLWKFGHLLTILLLLFLFPLLF